MIIEVLKDFPSAMPPPECLFDLIQMMQPRSFSISCSQKKCPSKIEITMAKVSFKTPYKRIRTGMCSSWLCGLNPTDRVMIWTQKGSISMPRDYSTPIIMVGPGTGVAPFRSFIQDRFIEQQRSGLHLFVFHPPDISLDSS